MRFSLKNSINGPHCYRIQDNTRRDVTFEALKHWETAMRVSWDVIYLQIVFQRRGKTLTTNYCYIHILLNHSFYFLFRFHPDANLKIISLIIFIICHVKFLNPYSIYFTLYNTFDICVMKTRPCSERFLIYNFNILFSFVTQNTLTRFYSWNIVCSLNIKKKCFLKKKSRFKIIAT